MKRLSGLFLIALMSGGITLGAYKMFFEQPSFTKDNITTLASPLPVANYKNVGYTAEAPDFTEAAELALNSVVHVKNVSYRQVNDPMLEFFYGYRGGGSQAQVGTGSGVIISADGYIVTNNHVINGASEIEITLHNRQAYKAKLIGTDSQLDIALLKIDTDDDLSYAVFGDSDAVRVGEWVLAVGNPYNLNSTVTAGIISAKARNVGARNGNSIQSFIQTDAVVNPGNSGGALVNTRGELIGINTMISSNTGSYVGYSFAVPSNITRKTIEDIMEFGNVQKGVLGVKGGELNQAVSEELGLQRTQGFYVNEVTKDTGAEKAGIQKGDVIVRIDNQIINSFAELTGYINTKRPDDLVDVYVIRKNKELKFPVKLTKSELLATVLFGMEVENLTAADKKQYGIDYGAKIKDAKDYDADFRGKIVLSVNGVKITDVQNIPDILSRKNPRTPTRIELMNQKGEIERYIIR